MNAVPLAMIATLLASTLASAQSIVPLFRDGDRVLFQGDSITDGGRGRTADPNHVLGHSYAFLIAARHAAAFPERGLTFVNRGISGNRVPDLLKRWQPDAIEQRPDVLSVLIGINDIGQAFHDDKPFDLDAYERGYDKLLADVVAAHGPGLRIILIDPFCAPGARTAARLDEWRRAAAQARDVVARLGEKYRAPVVHAQRVFDDAMRRAPIDYWIWDGIHPTFAGHELIADEWERVYADAYGPPPATTRPAFAH